ncbi:MAG: sensor histidine kinase, partial [Chitinophagaceae bacterium]
LLRPSFVKTSAPRVSSGGGWGIYIFIINDLFWIGLFYFNAFFLMPAFFYRKRIHWYILFLIFLFGLELLLFRFTFYLFSPHGNFDWRHNLLVNYFIFSFILASSIAYQLILDKLRSDRISKEKETEFLKTELSLLRSQVSPHFMFNVMNNMVALARKKSDLLEPSLIKLSALMRYMIYEGQEEKVELTRELEYLQSYIDLQQQRFGDKVKIVTRFRITDSGSLIEPMLLIPFVENAFKHGTGILLDPEIHIDLQVESKKLGLKVRNRFNSASAPTTDDTPGIGLVNVKRRLDLLYGQDQRLIISGQNGWFTVDLQINLF